VLHQWHTGALTVPRYLAECLRHGYRRNRFEIEARAFADRHVARLHALLRASAEQRLAAVEPRGHRDQQRP
jgi:hypothetical protein